MRVMGLDVGTVRIGVAISDPLGGLAQPHGTIECDPNAGEMNKIRALVEEYAIGEIVVGLPLSMTGEAGPQAKRVTDFVAKLEELVDVPIKLWDERLSSIMVEKAMISGDVKRKKRKQSVDKLAAAVILQGYLDSRRMQFGGRTE